MSSLFRTIGVAFLLSGLGTITGCGGTTNADSECHCEIEAGVDAQASGRIDDYRQFFEQYAQALCEGMKTCCINQGYPINPNCQSDMDESLRGGYFVSSKKYDPEAVPSSVRYDPEKAYECVQDARNLGDRCSESEYSDNYFLCEKVFQGTLRPGEPCISLLQCSPYPGGYFDCQSTQGPGSELDKRCVHIAIATEGEPCGARPGPDYDLIYCEDEFYCSYTTGLCTRYPQVGESCADSPWCGFGYCNTSTLICEPWKHPGEPCQAWEMCSTHSCTNGLCDVELYPGDKCEKSSDYCNCVAGLCRARSGLDYFYACQQPL